MTATKSRRPNSRPGRRSHPERSAYAGVRPLPINNEQAELRSVLRIADEQDARSTKPTARLFALKRVKTRGQPFPVKGKNKNQRARLQAGFEASRVRTVEKITGLLGLCINETAN